jgi:hypothetical protein
MHSVVAKRVRVTDVAQHHFDAFVARLSHDAAFMFTRSSGASDKACAQRMAGERISG